jgi:hypothetical protein
MVSEPPPTLLTPAEVAAAAAAAAADLAVPAIINQFLYSKKME